MTDELIHTSEREAAAYAAGMLRAQLYRHRATTLRAAIVQTVEQLGASPELTNVVVMLQRLGDAIHDLLDERDSLRSALTAAQAEADTLRAQLARNAQEEESGDLPVAAYLEDFLNPPVGYIDLARRQCGPNADPTVVNAQARGIVARAFEAAIRCQLDLVVESWESALAALRQRKGDTSA